MKQWRKPVSEITDRAKRYRANRVKPRGPKRCAYAHRLNPCKGKLGVNHVDGNESHGQQSNLNWACKRHNAQLALYHKAKGKGVRTRQFNPVASNLAQYVQAAVEHTRGSHDAGGKVIHETPKSKRKAFAREIAFRKGHRNPEDSGSDKMYRTFHGKRGKTIDTGLPIADFNSHPHLAALGVAVSVVIGERVRIILDDKGVKEVERLEADDKRAWFEQIGFDRNPPQVASEPSGKQIFFVGGNQDISAELRNTPVDTSKELIDCGPCLLLEYKTQKGFDDFRTVDRKSVV